jgi:hypothetical protein
MGTAFGVAGLIGGLAQIASIASAVFLGARLIRRGVRGRAAPELLLGTHLLLSIGVGSLLLTISSVSVYDVGHYSERALYGLTFAGNAITILGLMAALWFNSTVFHAGQRVGRMFALAGCVAMWIGLALLFRSGALEAVVSYGRAYWPLAFAMLAADVWVATEALHFRAQLRRRLALGLVEPLVVERLGLWATAAIARMGLVSIAPLTNGLVPSTEARAALAPWMLLLSALLILVTCISYWLMLAPTDGYRRWVERRYAPARA